MKSYKTSFVCLLLFGLFLSFNLTSQTISDADKDDDKLPDIHYEAGMGCIDCHGSSDLHNMHWDLTTNSSHTMPHDNSIAFYENYLANNTNESAAMNCVNLEGVKTFIENYK